MVEKAKFAIALLVKNGFFKKKNLNNSSKFKIFFYNLYHCFFGNLVNILTANIETRESEGVFEVEKLEKTDFFF